jgi:hypothetical protein
MPLYAIGPLHPPRLRCHLCGTTVAGLPDDGEAPPYALTADQAGQLWPRLAADLTGHDAVCLAAAPGAVRVRVAE